MRRGALGSRGVQGSACCGRTDAVGACPGFGLATQRRPAAGLRRAQFQSRQVQVGTSLGASLPGRVYARVSHVRFSNRIWRRAGAMTLDRATARRWREGHVSLQWRTKGATCGLGAVPTPLRAAMPLQFAACRFLTVIVSQAESVVSRNAETLRARARARLAQGNPFPGYTVRWLSRASGLWTAHLGPGKSPPARATSRSPALCKLHLLVA
jgi:hypothetical protein